MAAMMRVIRCRVSLGRPNGCCDCVMQRVSRVTLFGLGRPARAKINTFSVQQYQIGGRRRVGGRKKEAAT